jgi:predicted acylesterase/phospholipase RssA
MLGVLHYYYEKGMYVLELIRECSGTSIGAAISLLLICGYTPMEIFNEIYSLTKDLFEFKYGSMWEMMENMGLTSISHFTDHLRKMVISKLGCDPSLRKLKEMTGITLHISGSNSSRLREEHYSYLTHPKLSCVNAVGFSCNLFPIFHRIKYRGDYIVDGGYTNNVPWNYLSERCQNTLCVVIDGNDYSFPSESTFIGYALRIFMLNMCSSTNLRCELAPSSVKIVKATWPYSSILNLNTSSEEKMKMFLKGYQTAEQDDKTRGLWVEGWNSLLEIE